MQPFVSLAAHLRTLTQDQLTGLVSIRRDATFEPAPTTADQLAERLLHPSSMVAACALLTLPELQVAEAAAALGAGCGTARLADLLDVPEDDPDLAAALRRLAGLVLIWPHDGGLAAGHLGVAFSHPLDLGPGAADLLVTLNPNELRKLAKLYGVAGNGRDALIGKLAAWLARPENVRGMVTQAPADVLVRLRTMAAATFGPSATMFGTPQQAPPWAVDRGLVIRSAWGSSQMPREVTLALREGYVAPFDARPPSVPTVPVAPEVVDREAAAAAAETLAAVTAIVQAIRNGPVPLLKSGGLGVRELRRIAKSADQDEDRTRLTIELLAAEGLIDASESGLIPATAYEEFAAAEPADQLLGLIDAWLTMPACPLAPVDPTASAARVLYWDEEEEVTFSGLRALTLRTLVEAVPDQRAAEPAAIVARVAWQGPVLTDQAGDDLDRYVTGIWHEAHRLGLLAHGSLTELCRSRLSGDPGAAGRQAEAMLPRARDTVLLQNDLTAVVTGTPAAGLLALLDGAATPESRSGAWIWRFSPASVRAALDAGHTRDGLLAGIAGAAEGGRVPQTLTYLIDDVARRYGAVQVRPTGCCLCSGDETLLTEILHTRSLQALKLVRLAPTVLASAKSPAESLAALRAAGYAPASVGADGSPAIEIRQRRRAAPVRDGFDIDAEFPMPVLIDPTEVARSVLADR